jgi:hypothetical protein
MLHSVQIKNTLKVRSVFCFGIPNSFSISGGFDKKMIIELWDITDKNDDGRLDHATWMVIMGTFFGADDPVEKLRLQIRCNAPFVPSFSILLSINIFHFQCAWDLFVSMT